MAPELARGRVVVAHLGNGASLCGLRDGKAVDTTMGFTALDGLCDGDAAAALSTRASILYLLADPRAAARRTLSDAALQEVGADRHIRQSAPTCATCW